MHSLLSVHRNLDVKLIRLTARGMSFVANPQSLEKAYSLGNVNMPSATRI